MVSELVRIADAVTQTLNEAAVAPGVTAVRTYRPVFELPELKTLHLTVAPKGIELRPETRAKAACDYKVDVAVQKKFETGDAAELDPLTALAETIADLFRAKPLPNHPTAVWVKTEHVAVFAPEHLEQMRLFTSVLTLTFRVWR